jgi:hypothetical protein
MEYVLGVLISLIIQGLKKLGDVGTFETYLVLVAVSVAGAGVYVFLSAQSFWPIIVQIITVAAAFHNLILRRFESN